MVGEQVELTFSIVDAQNFPLKLRSFYFTFFDLDQGANNQEWLCVNDGVFHQLQLVEGTRELDILHKGTNCAGESGTGSTMFASNSRGFLCDNPEDPIKLGVFECEQCDRCASREEYFPIDQNNRSVEFTFRGIHSFNISLGITDFSGGSVAGRNILFAGRSSLSLCPDPSPQPTSFPSLPPTPVPSLAPTFAPSAHPTYSLSPTPVPTLAPSPLPTNIPTNLPSPPPSPFPTPIPTMIPTITPVPTRTFFPTGLN